MHSIISFVGEWGRVERGGGTNHINVLTLLSSVKPPMLLDSWCTVSLAVHHDKEAEKTKKATELGEARREHQENT